MTNLSVIENKISAVRKYSGILQRYQQRTQQEIENNIELRGTVERYLYLITQTVIDLAEAVISLKDYRKPTTLAETFRILNEAGMIDQTLTEKMVKMTGFRNIIAHDYEDLDYSVVYRVLHSGIEDIHTFLEHIQEKI